MRAAVPPSQAGGGAAIAHSRSSVRSPHGFPRHDHRHALSGCIGSPWCAMRGGRGLLGRTATTARPRRASAVRGPSLGPASPVCGPGRAGPSNSGRAPGVVCRSPGASVTVYRPTALPPSQRRDESVTVARVGHELSSARARARGGTREEKDLAPLGLNIGPSAPPRRGSLCRREGLPRTPDSHPPATSDQDEQRLEKTPTASPARVVLLYRRFQFSYNPPL